MKNLRALPCLFSVVILTIMEMSSQQFTIPYTFHYGKALDLSPFRILVGLSLDDCRTECQGRLRCLSFNFKANICELNEERETASIALKDRPGSVYQEKPPGPPPYVLQCGTSMCGINEVCDYKTSSCSIKECEPYVPPQNGKVLGNDFAVGRSIRTGCKHGFVSSTGSLTMQTSTCLQNGSWDITPSQCIELTTPAPTTPLTSTPVTTTPATSTPVTTTQATSTPVTTTPATSTPVTTTPASSTPVTTTPATSTPVTTTPASSTPVTTTPATSTPVTTTPATSTPVTTTPATSTPVTTTLATSTPVTTTPATSTPVTTTPATSTPLTTTPVTTTTTTTTPQLIEQWVSTVTGFSSQFGNDGYSAKQIIGQHDVFPSYNDVARAWVQATLDANQFIEIQFPEPVQVKNLTIYETYNAGGIKSIKVKDGSGNWKQLWSTATVQFITQPRMFTLTLSVGFVLSVSITILAFIETFKK